MKIAYVYDAVHPWVTGGIETRVWELATRLTDDHEVHWYGLKWWEGPAVIDRQSVVLHGVSDPPADLYTNGRRSIPEAIGFAARLTRPLLGADYDLIDCQAFPYFPSFPSKLAATRGSGELVVTWHEVWDDYWYEYLGRKGVFGKAVERLVSRLPDRNVVVSERTRRELAAIGGDDPILLPNGISLEAVRAIQPAAETPDVVFAGRLIKEKNVELLLHAIEILRSDGTELQCVVIGDGPERDALERYVDARDLTPQIDFRGFVDDHDEVLGLLKAAQVFAFPSRREGFGITALEALACGTPVVTIDHPQNAAADLVEDGSTGIVSDANAQAFARGIEAAGQLPSAACVEAARDYDWDHLVEQVDAAYRAVCA